MRRFRRSFRRSGSRSGGRAKEWLQWNTFANESQPLCFNYPFAMGAATIVSAWILPPNVNLEEFDEPTVVRMIQRWAYFGNLGPATSAHLAQGIIAWKSPDDASPANPPSPLLNGSYDWLWYNEFWLYNPSGVNNLIVSSPGSDKVTFEDVRAKRKLESGFGLLYVAETDDCNGAGVSLNAGGRVLLLNR